MCVLLADIRVACGPDAELRTPARNGSPADLVLVVEDDSAIAGLLRMLLQRRGRRTLHARDAAEALQVFAQHESEIALVLLDCRLPDMHGGELCRRLRGRVPGLPVIFTSGRDQAPLARTMAGEAATAFLPKPFFPAEVDRVVNTLLPAIA